MAIEVLVDGVGPRKRKGLLELWWILQAVPGPGRSHLKHHRRPGATFVQVADVDGRAVEVDDRFHDS